MNSRTKISLTVLVFIAMSAIFECSAWLLNYPNDLVFVLGVLVVIALFLFGPVVIYRIWKMKQEEKPTNETPQVPIA